VKFALVVMFYMHLKFDHRFFTFLLGGPLLLAFAVVVSLLFIFYGSIRLRTGM
jgi:cytochrome c oxidase subunit 4